MTATRRAPFALPLARPAVARAQGAFPSRTVSIVVPFPPGGGTDVLARILAQHVQEAWRGAAVVETQTRSARTSPMGASSTASRGRADERRAERLGRPATPQPQAAQVISPRASRRGSIW